MSAAAFRATHHDVVSVGEHCAARKAVASGLALAGPACKEIDDDRADCYGTQMVRSIGFLVIGATLLIGTAATLSAAPLSFTVTAEKKRFDVDRSATVSTMTTKEKWGYSVTLENKAFKPLENLEVQYRQFKMDDTRKGPGKLKGVPGSTKIEKMGNGEKFKFDTDAVEIEKQELKAGWSYTDGSKSKVKDALSGLWVRVVKDGETVYETQLPADLKNKAKWE
jgi:hypothetical protein